jgi:protein TonB
MTTVEHFRRMSLSAAATSGLLHVAVLLAILSQVPWSLAPRSASLPPGVELSFEREDNPSPPDVTELPAQPLPPIAAAAAVPAPPPPPAPPGPDLAQVVPLANQPPPILDQELPKPVPVDKIAMAPAPAPPSSPPAQAKPSEPPPRLQTKPVQPKPPSPPAASARQQQIQEDYLLKIVRKLASRRFVPRRPLPFDHGVVVTRLTVGRDGRLLDASLVASSGIVELDNITMEAIRRAAPFAPLPPDIEQDSYTVTLPVRFSPAR